MEASNRVSDDINNIRLKDPHASYRSHVWNGNTLDLKLSTYIVHMKYHIISKVIGSLAKFTICIVS